MLPQAENSWTLFEAAHLLNRAGFGGSPSEIKAFHALGRLAAVDRLIKPSEPLDAFPAPSWSWDEAVIAANRARLDAYKMSRKEKMTATPEQIVTRRQEAVKQFQKESRAQALEAQAWWFRRMLKSEAPLREKMTLFWHDHFVSSVQKVKYPILMVKQNNLFRENAFGSFEKLTQAIVTDPAMLIYLDNEKSNKDHPNENFAREVMELFTLGEGNYTEQDVREAARAFTGYSVNRITNRSAHRPKEWDSSPKTLFGQTGPYNGQDVIRLIFEKKATSRFMVNKLWEFFVYDKPSSTVIDALSTSFTTANYEVGPLLREIFLSKEFYAPAANRNQIKCPVQYIITLLKQLEVNQPPQGFPITAQLQLGQILFMPPNVAGWDWGQAWINTNTLLTRYNLAGYLAKGAAHSENIIPQDKVKIPKMGRAPREMGATWKGPDYETIAPRSLREKPADLVDSLIFRFFQNPLPEKARSSFIAYATAKQGAILTNQETAELCHLILSTPYYQLT
jgi:uncharacterized protein (DUF1800 family)